MGPEKILILSVLLFTTVSANHVRSKRQLLNTDSGNVGGVHNTTNNVGLFVGAADAIKAVPIGQGPLVSVGDVKLGRQKRQLFSTDSGNVGGTHETTNNVGPFVGLSDAINAVPIGKSPLISVGDVNVGGKQKRQLFSTDSGNVGGTHETTNNVGPLVGLSDAINAVPIGKSPLISVGDVGGRQKRGVFCFLGVGCDNSGVVVNNDIGHTGGSYSTVNTAK